MRRTGWLTAGVGCWHRFNERWAEEVRRAGGLDVVFADCFRGFEYGCKALIRDLMQRQMIRRRTDARDHRHCALTFAVSDRFQRTQGWSASAAVVDILVELMKLFYEDGDCPYTGHVLSHRAYGATMHYFTAIVHERQWTPSIPGFNTIVQHTEERFYNPS